MTINELIEKAHSQAKSMGWWDQPRNTGELLMLIVSECGEALEAHRGGMVSHLGNTELLHIGVSGGSLVLDKDMWVDEFRSKLKDHMADELADIVIRIADYMGHMGHVFGDYDLSKKMEVRNVGECLLQITSFICSARSGSMASLDAAILGVFWIANARSIDLDRHIQLKLAYNRTRGTRHGKAY